MGRNFLAKKNVQRYAALGKKSIKTIRTLAKKAPEFLDRASQGLDKAGNIAMNTSKVLDTAGYKGASKTVLGASKTAEFGSKAANSTARAGREAHSGNFNQAAETLQKGIVEAKTVKNGPFV
jgi:hypothetical protein